MSDLTDAVAALDTQVRHALATGDQAGLEVLGYGEISLVVALETGEGRFACKRLPRFDDDASLARYTVVLGDYLTALGEAGIEAVPSELVRVPGPEVISYCVQPALDPASLGPVIAGGDGADDFLGEVVETTAGAVGDRLGVDAQISNWARVDSRLVYLDVTTPLLRDATGAERADLGLFLASLPWALRGPVRRFLLDDILRTYYDPRRTLLDLTANLSKERLDSAVPSTLDVVNTVVDPPVTADEVRAYYARDARMWALLQRLRRVDRGWQRHVRRRTYPFLLPPDIDR